MNPYQPLAVGLLLLGCVACNNDAGAPPTRPVAKATPVEFWQARLSEVDERIESVATLSAFESVAVTSRVSGKVAAVHFEDGAQVAANQLLIELDTAEPAARVTEIEAALREARSQLKRLGTLGADISTRAAIDIAEANVAAEEARLAQANANLADHQLRAPFAGTLGFRQVSKGALITPGTVVAELDDLSQLKLDFTIPEVYLARLQAGDRVLGQSPAWPDETFSATVRSIGSRVDPVTRAVTVRGVLDNSAGRLRPGMLMTIELVVGQAQAMVLPEEALMQKGTDSFIFSVDDEQRAVSVPVSIVRRVEGGVVVTGNLSPQQAVVVRGGMNLRPGMPVREVSDTAAVEGGQI